MDGEEGDARRQVLVQPFLEPADLAAGAAIAFDAVGPGNGDEGGACVPGAKPGDVGEELLAMRAAQGMLDGLERGAGRGAGGAKRRPGGAVLGRKVAGNRHEAGVPSFVNPALVPLPGRPVQPTGPVGDTSQP